MYGFWPANSDGDDIVLYTDEIAHAPSWLRFHTLRQQWERKGKTALHCAWPTSSPRSTAAAQDYIGAFAVTTGLGIDELVAKFDADHDDYNSIMVKALADRLAEAFAECLHEGPRRLGLRRERTAVAAKT